MSFGFTFLNTTLIEEKKYRFKKAKPDFLELKTQRSFTTKEYNYFFVFQTIVFQ